MFGQLWVVPEPLPLPGLAEVEGLADGDVVAAFATNRPPMPAPMARLAARMAFARPLLIRLVMCITSSAPIRRLQLEGRAPSLSVGLRRDKKLVSAVP
jgi:hypothetical protein